MYALREAPPGVRTAWDYQSETNNPDDPDIAIKCTCGGESSTVDLEISMGASIKSRACPGWIMDGDGVNVDRKPVLSRQGSLMPRPTKHPKVTR